MKINLLYDSNELRSGYINVDPFDFENKQKTCCDLTDLYFCSDAECADLLCNGVLSYYSTEEVQKMLDHYLSKLGHKGRITISDINGYEVARKFTLGQLGLMDYNNLMYGEKHKRKSTIGITEVVNYLKSRGMNILEKQIKDNEFCVKAERP